MGVLLNMVSANVPLHTWRTFAQTRPAQHAGIGWFSEKKLDRVAGAIVAGLANDETIALVAAEWESLPALLRSRITLIANGQRGTSSNNRSKGIVRLDKLLGGKILSTIDRQVTERKLRVIDGKLVSVRQVVQPGVAGAERAFAAFTKPPGYSSWSPARKRAYQQEVAAARRQDKR